MFAFEAFLCQEVNALAERQALACARGKPLATVEAVPSAAQVTKILLVGAYRQPIDTLLGNVKKKSHYEIFFI